jgi:hypothetical protein
MRLPIAAVLFLLVVSPQQPPALADFLLPDSALSAAEAGPLPLGFLLARFGIPTGIVTTDNPSDPEIFKVGTSGRASVPLADVVARFAATHSEHVAAIDRGILEITRKGLLCGRQIDLIAIRPTVVDGDLSKLLVLLSWLASGEPPPGPRGIMSDISNKPGEPPAPSLPLVHFASTAGTTLKQAFDRAVQENKGGAWIVWQHVLPDGRIACRSAGYYGDGRTVGASAMDFWTEKQS